MSEDAPNYRVTLLGELLPELIAENAAAAEARKTGRPRGPITSLERVDRALGGFLATGVHVLQSAPGGGKTAFGLQVAASCGFPSLYVTTEMPMLELFRRLIARSTNTFLGRLKTGELSDQELTDLAQRTIEESPWIAILDATASYVRPDTIRDVSIGLKERTGYSNVLLVIDSLQYWARSVGELSEYERVSLAIRSMSEVAAQLSSPVLAISHRNRQGNKGDGGMFASKGSGDVEYAAESILELAPPFKEVKPDTFGNTIVNLTIHKNRHGEPGRVIPLQFNGRVQKFVERDDE